MRQHILDTIRAHARSSPHKCALADSRVSIRYAGLDDLSTRIAIRLCELGCEPGARVAMVADRRASLVAAILIFRRAAFTFHSIARMPSGRLQYILSDIAPAIVITDDDLRDTVAAPLLMRAKHPLVSNSNRSSQSIRRTARRHGFQPRLMLRLTASTPPVRPVCQKAC